MNLKFEGKGLRYLDFDSECRPLTYLGSDYTTAEVTAIAWCWVDDVKSMQYRLLGEDDMETILGDFVKAYNEADVVTGHYILGHDLPVLNGALLEQDQPPLGDKLVQDTKVHLITRKYVSASQESLSGMLGIDAPKVQMDQTKWRKANRLLPAGLELTKQRVVGDVIQHMQMREELLRLHWLNPPVLWSRGGASVKSYTP